MYLAAAGVGTLGIVDFDVVEASNLHRQVIHGTSDIGRPKLDSAEDSLKAINPNVNIVKFSARLSSENALEIFKDFDIIADGTDNFPTRYLVNDACVLSGSRTPTRPSSALKDRPACLRRRTDHAIAACILNRRRPD